MKKLFIILTLSLMCACCVVGFAACNLFSGQSKNNTTDGINPDQKYTATIVVDGETVATRTFNAADTVIADLPEVPAKDGYTGKWEYEIKANNITVVAVYVAITYNATFIVDGESIAIKPFTVEDDEIRDLPEIPAKEGYTGKWQYEIKADNINVVAVYTPTTYNATFIVDGESIATKPFNAEDNEIKDLPAVPAKEGYTGSWKYEIKAENITVVAVYVAITYNATFIINGKSVATKPFTVEDNEIKDLPEIPAKEGYTGKWEYKIKADNINVVAVYTPITYKATFVANGTSVATKPFTVEDKTIKNMPQVPAKEGYTGSWQYEIKARNITVIAVYVAITYNATFIIDGVNIGTRTFTIEDSEIKDLPAVPEKEGYTGKWQYEIKADNINVVAVYTPITYNATFIIDGVNIGTRTFTIEDSEIKGLPEVPAKEGYTGKWEYEIKANNITVTVVYTAAQPTADEYFTFKLLDDDTYEIKKKDGKTLPNVIIFPSTYNGKPVTHIGDKAFYNYSSLTSITIPDSVTLIGEGAFRGCGSLISIKIPDSVTSIGNSAFSYCTGLTSIIIPDSVTSIGDSAFKGCKNLTTVTIGNGVTSIGDYAFARGDGSSTAYMNLTTVTIGNSVTSIGSYAFYHCSSLTSIKIPDSVTSIGNSAFAGCGLTSITIPDSVTSIGNHAFEYCSLRSITIPDSVTNIDYGAFYHSSLTSITIPDSVTSIGEDAFSDCSSLTSVIIGNSVTSIGDYAFLRCSSLTSITIPDSVTSIGHWVFGHCSSLTSITIPDSVTSVMPNVFNGCSSLTSATGPACCSYFGCSGLKTVVITSGEVIGWGAFQGCSSLTSITIPDSVTSIEEKSFYGCSSLTNITIPENVTYIGNSAFSGCSSLTSIEIPDGTRIGDYVFYNCSSLTSITIPNSVTSIMGYAFYGCRSLTNITIPENVTYIGNSAFSGCSSLTSITIPDGVTSISGSAFSGCSSLTSIIIPDGVTSIGESAFSDCSSLTSINIPDSVTWIEDYAFSGCSNLQYNEYDNWLYLGNENNPYMVLIKAKSKDITSCVTHKDTIFIASYSFADYSSLTSVTIGNNVKRIGRYAFYNCSGLTSVIFENKSDWRVKVPDGRLVTPSFDMANPSTTAYYLSHNYSAYYSYYWQRV